MVAIPAVIALGLSKGGFAGVGVRGDAADRALSAAARSRSADPAGADHSGSRFLVWWYRKDWDSWNLKVLLPGALVGMGARLGCSRLMSPMQPCASSVGTIGISFVPAPRVKKQSRPEAQRKTALSGFVLGRRVGVHLVPVASWRPALSGACAAAAPAEADPGRHHHDLLCDRERAEDRPLFRARAILHASISRPPWCCCRSRSPPTRSASGWCG